MSGGMPAGVELRAAARPVCLTGASFEACDAAADGAVRATSNCIARRVVIRRAVRRHPHGINLPVSAYRGVSIRLSPGSGMEPSQVAVFLDIADPSLALDLYVSPDGDESRRRMADLGRALERAASGCAMRRVPAEEIFARPAGQVERAFVRRRRRNAIKRRRPYDPRCVVATGKVPSDHAGVYRAEREIIARN